MKNLRVLIDLDEVIVDWIGGALEVHGWTREQLHATRPPGEYWLNKAMGMTEEEFAAPIKALGEAFWTGLKPLPWALQVIDTVVEYYMKYAPGQQHDWWICTSTFLDPVHSAPGKIRWMQNHFQSAFFDRYILTDHKYLLAKEGVVLIDDSDHQVDAFRAAGGSAILLPRRHNSRHEIADTDLVQLVQCRLRKLHGIYNSPIERL